MVKTSSLELHPIIILILCRYKWWQLPLWFVDKVIFCTNLLWVLKVCKYEASVSIYGILLSWFLSLGSFNHHLRSSWLLLLSLCWIILLNFLEFNPCWIPIFLCHCCKLKLFWIFFGTWLFRCLTLRIKCIYVRLVSIGRSSLCRVHLLKLT